MLLRICSLQLLLLQLDMSSVCGGLDFKDAESHLESSSASSPSKCSSGSKHISCVGSEDAQESDGDDSGYIPQNVNEESNDSKPIPESLPLNSLDNEGEDKNLATSLQDMFSENVSDTMLLMDLVAIFIVTVSALLAFLFVPRFGIRCSIISLGLKNSSQL